MRRRATGSAVALTAAALLCVACGGPAPAGAPAQGPARPTAATSPVPLAPTGTTLPALGPGPTVTGPAPSARPPSKPATSADRALAAAFVAFARAPGRRTAARVPFADRVGLALTDDVRRTVARADVADPSR